MNVHQEPDTLFADALPVAPVVEHSTDAPTENPTGPTCEQCGAPFQPRKGSGGKPQRFCSQLCRAAFNKATANTADDATATERRAVLVEGVNDFDKKFPTETATELVDRMMANGGVGGEEEHPYAEFAESREPGDLESFWGIDSQVAIEARPLKDGGVEIAQQNPSNTEEDKIHVAAGNAVRLARSILYAAGFANIGIFTSVKGGNQDVEDGDEPRHFRPLPHY